jgi:hypothetical protein
MAEGKVAGEPLVLVARVKRLVNQLGCKMSGEVPAALNELVAEAIKAGVKRTRGNGRSTLRPVDL